jgi:ABC-type phosphate transport system ATPase subunit
MHFANLRDRKCKNRLSNKGRHLSAGRKQRLLCICIPFLEME